MDIIAFNIEYADKKVLEKLLDWAYDWVVAEQQYSDEILHAKDLSEYVLCPASIVYLWIVWFQISLRKGEILPYLCC